jgi:hypothetical protein
MVDLLPLAYARGSVLLLVLLRCLDAQTSCSVEHSGPGVFICSPGPADEPIPEYFHVSAQANALSERGIRHYQILLDGKLQYDSIQPIPHERLSIEVNLRSGLMSGTHTLRAVVDEAGIAEVQDLKFHTPAGPGFCDVTEGFLIGTCMPPRHLSALVWSLPGAPYQKFLDLYRRNLKSFEADIADAAVPDSQGNLFVAFHLLAGLEVRKYSPNGSIVHNSVMAGCRDASLGVSALAVDNSGHLWIAGNTKAACLPTTAGAWHKNVPDTAQKRGFVLLVDLSKPMGAAQVYATYLADVDGWISDMAVDADGNAYVAGGTRSSEFPHTNRVRVGPSSRGMGFVSVLNRDGSGLQWSTLIDGVEIRALALDSAGKVFVTGRNVLLAELPDGGKKISYKARLAGKEARAIAVSADGRWAFVQGENFLLNVQPFGKEKISPQTLITNNDSNTSEIANGMALRAFAADFVSRAQR